MFGRAPSSRRFISAQAVVYDRLGNPDSVLRTNDASIGNKLQDNEALVKMLAAPVQAADLAAVSGLVPGAPSSGVCGNEGIGIVEEVGSAVSMVAKGDKVITAKFGVGTWASHIVADESSLVSIPQSVSADQVALINSNHATALHLLSGVEAGVTVVCNSANSVLGFALAQIAKEKGINMISLVSPDCVDFKKVSNKLKAAGSSIVGLEATASTPAFRKACQDLNPSIGILMPSSSKTASASLARLLSPNGTLFAVAGAGPVTVPSSLLIDRGISIKGFNLVNSMTTRESVAETVNALLGLSKESKIATPDIVSEPLSNFKVAISKALENPCGTVLLKM